MGVGMFASMLGVGVTNALMGVRQMLDPTFVPLNPPQDVLIMWVQGAADRGAGGRWGVQGWGLMLEFLVVVCLQGSRCGVCERVAAAAARRWPGAAGSLGAWCGSCSPPPLSLPAPCTAGRRRTAPTWRPPPTCGELLHWAERMDAIPCWRCAGCSAHRQRRMSPYHEAPDACTASPSRRTPAAACRYQLVAGLIEERGIEVFFKGNPSLWCGAYHGRGWGGVVL